MRRQLHLHATKKNDILELLYAMESYRSGHNEAHSKCVCRFGRHEGSNPSDSAIGEGFFDM